MSLILDDIVAVDGFLDFDVLMELVVPLMFPQAFTNRFVFIRSTFRTARGVPSRERHDLVQLQTQVLP